ncbi:MAG: hypothetical protein IJC84_06630 [Clostridia bacterium]|nr:hypothetical protein [Clostridia bacterium]
MVSKSKSMGMSVVAFGLGILVACFLPDAALIVLEAAVIVTAGVLFSKC